MLQSKACALDYNPSSWNGVHKRTEQVTAMLVREGACLLRSVIRVEHMALKRFSMYSVSSSDLGSRFL